MRVVASILESLGFLAGTEEEAAGAQKSTERSSINEKVNVNVSIGSKSFNLRKRAYGRLHP